MPESREFGFGFIVFVLSFWGLSGVVAFLVGSGFRHSPE